MTVLERVREQEGKTGVADSEYAAAVAAQSDELPRTLKHELVSRLGLATVASMVSTPDLEQARAELRVTCQAILNEERFSELLPQEREQLTSRVLDEVVGLGPIQPLLDDNTVSEVMVNGCGALYFERDGRLLRSKVRFESADQIMMVVDRILAPLGRRLDKSSPLVNARLTNGDRVNAVAVPIAIDGPYLTIRKFSNRITSMDQLVSYGSLPAWYATLLKWAVQLRRDIAVAGGTGSGKTTLLNALSTQIDHGERVITIEDSAELRFAPEAHVVRMEARDASIEGTGEVTIRDLVKNALRQRPDRIVVGEVRGAEAIDMLQAMNTGHDGSLTTLHAGTAEEAILRLVLMARFGMDLPASIIEEQIATALDLIVMSARRGDGSRRITSLSQVSRDERGGVRLEEVVSYDQADDCWHLSVEPAFVTLAVASGALSEEEVSQWRSSTLRAACAA
ncbi:MAG: CpaF family protein [Atopobiaceae bacterium]|nr:CpaF family protein [Atopobiaceae bacterium]